MSYKVSLSVSPLPRGARSPGLHPPMPSVVLFFLRYSGRLPPRSFIRLLPCSCCLRPRSLLPLFHSGAFQHLYMNVRPFRLLGVTSSLFCPLRLCPAQRVIFLPAVVNSFCGPQFPCVRIFLKTFSLRHATVARRNIFLQVTANFLRDPQSPQVSSSGSPRRPAARCRPQCRFFIFPEDFTVAPSIGNSQCSTSDSISSGFSSLLFRHASVITWQDIVPFRTSLIFPIQAVIWISFLLG
jgi:hypothetical protein